MINRTAERVLTWIGNALHALFFLIFGGLLFALNLNSTEFKQSMVDSETTIEDANGILVIFNVWLIIILIISLIMLILSILSAVWIGKKNKAAGIILIVIGAFSLFGNAVVGVLWLVAGIMLLVRKPKTDTVTNQQNSFEEFEHHQEDYEAKDKQQKLEDNVDEAQNKENHYRY
ncbi:DUF4064 domain-containing protein [Staphylococcus gallinarum]|uniref:DUF4064 domain-containing protein n=1 Tax=Staphylococcus gallinarum TaxID=1293 RepID=A0A3A0W2E8_STAGA|nr:DUF4064 domain-containing protein [Staphylococcus gallinarum]RIP35012.1 DUF4064 domain-containing protein [Staphylococcus gallinarum]